MIVGNLCDSDPHNGGDRNGTCFIETPKLLQQDSLLIQRARGQLRFMMLFCKGVRFA